MTRTNLLIAPVLLAILLAFSACNKKEGCTDPNSVTYTSGAQVDNGTCHYEGQVNYWWNKSFLDSCQAHSITDIIVMSDGNELNRFSMTTQFWTSAPGCGAANSLTFRAGISGKPAETFSQFQRYFNASGLVATSPTYNISISANSCTTCQFIW